MTALRCPCCKQMLNPPHPKPTRICFDCGEPILRRHRWTNQVRRGETAIVHRVCCNPDSYYRAAENARIGVVGYKGMTKERIAELTAIEDALEAKFVEWRKANGKEELNVL